MLDCLFCGQQEIKKIMLKEILFFTKITEGKLCRKCKKNLVVLKKFATCRGCGRKLKDSKLCEDCLKWQVKYPKVELRHLALYEYNLFIKEWMERFKFQGDYRLRNLFNEEVKAIFKTYKKEIVIPVPISQLSYQKRGFNQVTAILKAAEIPYTDCLINEKNQLKQSSKTRKERLQMEQPFHLIKEKAEFIKNQSLVIVDDVYTTGRTILYAKDILIKHGARNVRSFSIAR
ncbi:hypothetical protein CKN63_00820 [Carnobacterium divergens]|uniref:ComF family protein n=1 Tax=Carnobacterium divergens TaxID=2748 RepID=UPI001071C349|nr:phosphoribosyltransferase family protein [Carnobacterium divergens]TFI69003.1 hypothetical protein CKN59_00820 [Carnobacterium divergens]TFI69128.1 hypothetical protein CKN76_00820 [Carnobacterium divergens]TFI83964.1 hypothetical protein CKN74_00820 [Carnobacterium divergens]TFJ10208.1 hypothetical protein CKN75_00820 [Carnobacterium divergens]TFJ14926.1 hypothetical protein CKN71_00820 [Carnobacterium divergens]